ncbi:MAG TPA: hypothetical protein VH583_24500 [Vicinamibacterales bacterium]|jgi:hypothetical protein
MSDPSKDFVLTHADGSQETLYSPTAKGVLVHESNALNLLMWGPRGTGKSKILPKPPEDIPVDLTLDGATLASLRKGKALHVKATADGGIAKAVVGRGTDRITGKALSK